MLNISWPKRVTFTSAGFLITWNCLLKQVVCLQLLNQHSRSTSSSIANTGQTKFSLFQGMSQVNNNPGSRHPRIKKALVL